MRNCIFFLVPHEELKSEENTTCRSVHLMDDGDGHHNFGIDGDGDGHHFKGDGRHV